MEKVIVVLNIEKLRKKIDIEVPLDITANDLVFALNKAYNLNINSDNARDTFLRAENPIALLKGNKRLKEYNISHGSIINVIE